jgi:oxygen-independent coproporphyrinogen-3 oxidase
MSTCREFTVEAGRPDSITPAKIQAMAGHHVTRVSVNPQTMQQRTLKLIGRQHTPEAVVDMYHALRAAGILEINMDLILGLPGETADDVRDTMEKVTALAPDDITLHALALKRGSRLKLIMEERHVDLPGDAETRRMSEVAMSFIEKHGYVPYYLYRQGYMAGDLENVGCCRPGAEGMYNIQIMEEHQTILGIGGSATTKVVDFARKRMKSSFNAKDLVTYLRDVDIYIEKRRQLLEEAYGKQGETNEC